MELEHIIKLIKTVSESNLSSFKYTEGNVNLEFEINRSAAPVLTNIGVNTIPNYEAKEETTQTKSNTTINSPMVGTFYAAKSEDSEPFIAVGDKVKKGQVIGIIEAMKLMNEIESPYDGIVDQVLVDNKDMVEYGQPLVVIR